jgi:hypothetical protein
LIKKKREKRREDLEKVKGGEGVHRVFSQSRDPWIPMEAITNLAPHQMVQL